MTREIQVAKLRMDFSNQLITDPPQPAKEGDPVSEPIPVPGAYPFVAQRDPELGDDPEPTLDTSPRIASPKPLKEFDGGYRGAFYRLDPPDTSGAVGHSEIVSPLNDYLYFFDREGKWLTHLKLNNFWNSMEGVSVSAFDPRILYDRKHKRWVMIAVAESHSTDSQLLIAVSDNENPRKPWRGTTIKLSSLPDHQYWLDFPQLGLSDDKIIVTGVGFSLSLNADDDWTNPDFHNGVKAYCLAFDKAKFYDAQSPMVCYCNVPTLDEQSWLAPSVSQTGDEKDAYLVQTGTGVLKLYRLSGPIGAIQHEDLGSVQRPSDVSAWNGNAGVTNFLPQKNTTVKVNAGDDRVQNLVFQNGKLWCVHTIFLPQGSSPTKSYAQWWRFNTDGSDVTLGRLDTRANSEYLAYPSIAVNDQDDAMIGMSAFSSSIFPSAAYATKKASAASFSAPRIYKAGWNWYEVYDSANPKRNRWGDYSATCVDPTDGSTFWTVQEFSRSDSFGSWWGTHWAKVKA